jgi:ribosomal-protein-alanine N-acetyltransferase
MRYEIGLPREADAAGLTRVAARSFDDPWSESAFRAELERPICRALVAFSRDKGVIGYVLGWRVGDEAQILSVAVDPTRRREGIALCLLEDYLARLRREGVQSVALEVQARNRPAQALYAKLGLVRQGERPRYYPGGETALLLGAPL